MHDKMVGSGPEFGDYTGRDDGSFDVVTLQPPLGSLTPSDALEQSPAYLAQHPEIEFAQDAVPVDMFEPIFGIALKQLNMTGGAAFLLGQHGWEVWAEPRKAGQEREFTLRNYERGNPFIAAYRDKEGDWTGSGAEALIVDLMDFHTTNGQHTDEFFHTGGVVDLPERGRYVGLSRSCSGDDCGPEVVLPPAFNARVRKILDGGPFHSYTVGIKEGPAFPQPQFGVEARDYDALFEKPKNWTQDELEAFRMRLPKSAKSRKGAPMAKGLLDYFPDACYDVARLSMIGNEQHNPGEELHWARGKGGNNRDELIRHTLQSRELDHDPITGKDVMHATKAAWRALAEAQLAIEQYRANGGVYPPEEE